MHLSLADWLGRLPRGLDPDLSPWAITTQAERIVEALIAGAGDGFEPRGGALAHRSATIEEGAVLKGPIFIGAGAFVAATTYLRGGVYLGEGAIVGPACELKSTFLLTAAKVAHLSFVGDSLIGEDANIEAGAMIANYRNERSDKRIRVALGDKTIDTGVEKFGALVGKHARIGANAVLAPGTLIKPGEVVPRLALIDRTR